MTRRGCLMALGMVVFVTLAQLVGGIDVLGLVGHALREPWGWLVVFAGLGAFLGAWVDRWLTSRESRRERLESPGLFGSW